MIEKVKSGISGAVDAIDSKLKDSLSFLSDIKEEGWEKVTTLINDIPGLAPLIEQTGYSMRDISIDASVPPGITIFFAKEKEVDPSIVENLLEQNREKQLLTMLVSGLQKADSLRKELNLSHYKFHGLGMKAGLPPPISLRFSTEEYTTIDRR